jgi:formate-dependent nitrite reductase membrane component NrfD
MSALGWFLAGWFLNTALLCGLLLPLLLGDWLRHRRNNRKIARAVARFIASERK